MINTYKEKINNILEFYKNSLNTNTSKIIKNNKNCNNSNVSFTRELASNQITGDQRIFSRIFNCTIKKAVDFLEVNVNSMKNSINNITNNSSNKYYIHDFKKLAIHRLSNIIEKKIYFDKMLIIFFFYFGIQRNLIYLMQKPYLEKTFRFNSKKTIPTEYGYINTIFYNSGKYTLEHPLKMDRLRKYLPRILENCKTLKKNKINFVLNKRNNKIYTKNICYNFCIYFDGINIFGNEILQKKECYMIIEYLKVNNEIIFDIQNVGNISKLGNISLTLDDRLYYLNVMSKILFKLDENKKQNINIEKQKEYIVAFYYLLILLMPFLRGTASIAEMSLYSLWKYYIGTSLNINQTVLLDVEALTLPFSIFYHNCFNGENRYLLF